MSLIKGIYKNMSPKSLNLTTKIISTDCFGFKACGSSEFKYLSYNFYINVLMSINFHGITSGNNKKYYILECYFWLGFQHRAPLK